ncbi:hypothetical protein [Nocardia yunnanensis]|uniref:hypothetical protein n=1 Tax=Nocardia yunnanensis TaxID=2382165 RepID=UPI0013C49F95|nr:hypothetical protein [Nocardia yunnanensis]
MSNPTPPVADPNAKRRKTNKMILGVFGAIVGVLGLLGLDECDRVRGGGRTPRIRRRARAGRRNRWGPQQFDVPQGFGCAAEYHAWRRRPGR